MSAFTSVVVSKGTGGWGGPLTIEPTETKKYVVSVTGGGIHPIAQQIADMTGGEAFDGFEASVKFEQMACAVIDCGGTARVGVYPLKGVMTVDVHTTAPSGPPSRFITDKVFVSGVQLENVSES